jgi:2-desacetyl-2-hydroxyethyl bacteriochlorophyllide A dehydrogenase
MRTLVWNGPSDVALGEAPVPSPDEEHVLVRIETSAICGSELHSGPGINPGHEAAGILEQVPDGSGFSVGERVGLSAVTGCGECESCHDGRQLFCRNGWRIHVGMHSEYVAVPVSSLRRLPEGTSPRDAVLITGDTLGVPVRGLRRVSSSAGDRVLVIGLGPVGLGHTLLRVHAGSEVVAIEPSEYRRDLAAGLGATAVLEPGEDIGRRPEVVVESTGLPACIQLALDLVADQGTVLQSGECEAMVEVNPSNTFIRREITYTGSWYYADEDYPEMVRRYEDGLPVSKLVTDVFPADDVAAAYEKFLSKNSGKILLDWTS